MQFNNLKNGRIHCRQLDASVNASALMTDVKDSTIKIEEDSKDDIKKDLKYDFGKTDNPNKDVSSFISQL